MFIFPFEVEIDSEREKELLRKANDTLCFSSYLNNVHQK